MTLRKKSFEKNCGKRRKCWKPAFSTFPTMFSARSKTEIKILAALSLSSANALHLVQSKILSFCKELNKDDFEKDCCGLPNINTSLHSPKL